MPKFAETKKRIQQMIQADEYEAIIAERTVGKPKGRIYVPNKFVGHKAIIIIEPLSETEGTVSK